ncbi:MAG TPA: ABC transporter permease [Symbiobacteriaceae bacterium]|nr:ABC transporter permease [Symbiobacteriaceae bacterium]
MRSWKSLQQVTLFEFRLIMRNKIAFLFNLVIPVVMVAILGAHPALVPALADLPGVEQSSMLDFLMPGELIYMLLASGLMSVAIGLSTRRQTGSLRHLFTTPLPLGAWLTAQSLATIMMAGLQIVVLFVFGWLFFGIHAPYNLPGTVVALIISALACLSMGLVAGVMVKSAEATIPLTIIIFFVLALFGNAVMPLDGAPAFMLTIQRLVPSYYMTHALRQVMMQGSGLATVAGDLAILAAWTVTVGGLAVWRIRRQVTAA